MVVHLTASPVSAKSSCRRVDEYAGSPDASSVPQQQQSNGERMQRASLAAVAARRARGDANISAERARADSMEFSDMPDLVPVEGTALSLFAFILPRAGCAEGYPEGACWCCPSMASNTDLVPVLERVVRGSRPRRLQHAIGRPLRGADEFCLSAAGS
jgi:hypothetical protein